LAVGTTAFSGPLCLRWKLDPSPASRPQPSPVPEVARESGEDSLKSRRWKRGNAHRNPACRWTVR